MTIVITCLATITGAMIINLINLTCKCNVLGSLVRKLTSPEADTTLEWFIILGAYQMVALLAVYFIVEHGIIRPAKTTKRHWARVPLEYIHGFLSNQHQPWPSWVLLSISLLHFIALSIVLETSLQSRIIGDWWSVTILLIGMWANHIATPPPWMRTNGDISGLGNGDAPISDDLSALDRSVKDLLWQQDFFHNQSVFCTPRTASIPIAAPTEWHEVDKRYRQQVHRWTTAAPTQPAASLVSKLHPHQTRVLELLRKSSPTVGHAALTTGIGSGRTTVSNLAALEVVLGKQGHVLIIHPEPDLGRAAHARFCEKLRSSNMDLLVTVTALWSDDAGVHSDGSGPPTQIDIADADILATDIQTLDSVLLPEHAKHQELYQGLQLIVAENMEKYSGILGADASLLFTRLRRVAAHYGAKPHVLAIGPQTKSHGNFIERFFNFRPDEFDASWIVTQDNRGRKQKEIIIWNPELFHTKTTLAGLGLPRLYRSSCLDQARRCLGTLLSEGFRTVLLNHSVPVCHSDVIETTQAVSQAVGDAISDPLILVGTSAEEVLSSTGDVSSPPNWDAAILTGMPGCWGAAMHALEHIGDDRDGDRAYIIVVLPDRPLAQYLARHAPRTLSQTTRVGETLLPLNNPVVQNYQLVQALSEIPASQDEVREWFGDAGMLALQKLKAGQTIESMQVPVLNTDPGDLNRYSPIAAQLQRQLGQSEWTVTLEGRTLSSMSVKTEDIGWRTYPGAVIVMPKQHQRVEVKDIDPDTKLISLTRLGEAVTSERIFERVVIREFERDAQAGQADRFLSTGAIPIRIRGVHRVQVQEVIAGYHRYLAHTFEHRERYIYNTPFDRLTNGGFESQALFIGVAERKDPNVWHTIAHVVKAVLPMFVNDADVLAEVIEKDGELVVYDAGPGGTGLADWLSRESHLREVLNAALDLISECPCIDGCGACTTIHNCRHRLTHELCDVDKLGAIKLLGDMLAVDSSTSLAYRETPIQSIAQIRKTIQYPIVHDIFPHKLGIEILEPADLIIDDTHLPTPLLGVYNRADNQVIVRPCPAPDMIAIIAHEYAHNWQWRGRNRMHPKLRDPAYVQYFNGKLIVEGFAQWVEYKVSEHYGFKEKMDKIKFRHFGAYLEGFHLLSWLEEHFGAGKVLNFVRSGELRIDGKEISIDALVDLAGVRARLLDTATQFKTKPPDDDVVVKPDTPEEPPLDEHTPEAPSTDENFSSTTEG